MHFWFLLFIYFAFSLITCLDMILTFFACKDLLDKCEALSKFIVKLRTEQSVKMIELTKTRKFNFYNKCSRVDSVNLNSRTTRCCNIFLVLFLYNEDKHFQLLSLTGSVFVQRKISQRLHQTFCRMLSFVLSYISHKQWRKHNGLNFQNKEEITTTSSVK